MCIKQCFYPFVQVPNDPSRPDSQSRGAHPSSVSGSVSSHGQPQSSVATTVLLADTQGLSVEQPGVSASGTTVCPTIQVQHLLFCMLPLLQHCNGSGKLRPAHIKSSNYCIGKAGYELQSHPTAAAASAASGLHLRQAGQSISTVYISSARHCIFWLRMQHKQGLQ